LIVERLESENADLRQDKQLSDKEFATLKSEVTQLRSQSEVFNKIEEELKSKIRQLQSEVHSSKEQRELTEALEAKEKENRYLRH